MEEESQLKYKWKYLPEEDAYRLAIGMELGGEAVTMDQSNPPFHYVDNEALRRMRKCLLRDKIVEDAGFMRADEARRLFNAEADKEDVTQNES